MPPKPKITRDIEEKIMYDIIIIGAGPAGCTAARTLAHAGYKVLLVEKFKLPRYKSCSGVLIKKTMDLVSLYFGETVPDFTMCTPTENKGMIFTNDKGKEYRFQQPGLNIWRSFFDNWLAQKAREQGVEIRDCTTAISCKEREDSVVLTLNEDDIYTETARYIIDCEGVVGAFKRTLRNERPQYITTFQTFNRGHIDLDPHYFYAYLQPELSEYDAWFNVKDDQLVLGVSVKDRHKINYYYDQFLTYMNRNHHLSIDRELRSEKWLMPRIHPGCPIDFGCNRVLFAGETAGFLNPMGEGISAGMESGYCAASAIAAHFDNLEQIYMDYKTRTQALKTYMEHQWSLVADLSDTFQEMKFPTSPSIPPEVCQTPPCTHLP